MPSVKRSAVKAEEKKTGFESYDGPEPTRRGMYRSKIRIFQFKEFKSGAQGFKILLEFEAQKGDPKHHAEFDGYSIWTNLVFGDKEQMLTREGNFYAALGLKDGPAIVFEEGDLKAGVDIKTLGGKSLAAIQKLFVNADVKIRTDGDYAGQPEVDGIYKLKELSTPEPAGAADEDEDDESDLIEDGDEEAEESDEGETEGDDPEARKEELEAAGLTDLRTLAKEYEIKTVGLKKDALVEAILDVEFPDGGAAALADDDEAEEEEAEEEDDEEAEEEEEAEEDDERTARVAELADLDRAGIKRVLKGVNPDFKVLTRHSDDDLRNAVIVEEFGEDGETPF